MVGFELGRPAMVALDIDGTLHAATYLRGSGQPIHPAVASALGVNPGQRRLFTTPQGPVTVLWRLSSTNGPSIGSIRAPTKALDADMTDTLVLIFRLDDASMNIERIGPEVSGIARLRRLGRV